MPRPRYALLRYTTSEKKRQTSVLFSRSRRAALAHSRLEPRKVTPEEAGEPVLYRHWVFETRLLPVGWKKPRIRKLPGATASEVDLLAAEIMKIGRLMAPCDLDGTEEGR